MSPQPDPPIPLLIVETGPIGELKITFDQPLTAGAVNGLNFTAHFDGKDWDGLAATAAGSDVTVNLEVSDIVAGPDVLSYVAGLDPLITSVNGDAPSFTDFAIT